MRNTLCALVAVATLAVGCANSDIQVPQPPKSEPNPIETIRWNGAEYRANFSKDGTLESLVPSDVSTHQPSNTDCYFPQGQEDSCRGYLDRIPLSAQSAAAIRSYVQVIREVDYRLKLDVYLAEQAAKKAK
jgi:hypothetical protein